MKVANGIFLVTLLLALDLPPLVADEPREDLEAALKTSLEEAETAYVDSKAALFAKYQEALNRLQQELQEAGDLKGVIAVREELERAEAGQMGAASEFDAIATLQRILQEQAENIERERVEARGRARQSFITQAEAQKRALTQAGEIDEAVALQAAIDAESDRLAQDRIQLEQWQDVPASPAAVSMETRGLIAHFSFDGAERAGLHPDSPEVSAQARNVTTVAKEGRTGADFNRNQAHVAFDPAIDLNDEYTIAFWHLFPPKKAAFLLDSDKGFMLTINDDGTFSNYVNKTSQTLHTPSAPLHGWHFIAITGDGPKTIYYLDGEQIAEIDRSVGTKLKILGNRPGMHGHWSMANLIDDLCIYDSVMDATAIARLREATRAGAAD